MHGLKRLLERPAGTMTLVSRCAARHFLTVDCSTGEEHLVAGSERVGNVCIADATRGILTRKWCCWPPGKVWFQA